MLEIKNLCAYYGKTQVLCDINLKFEKGKFYSVVGRNSSGKSTMLSCIASLIKYSGRVTIAGKDVSLLSDKERAKKISLLQQETRPVPFTVVQLCSFGRNAYAESRYDCMQKTESALRRVGISHLCDKKVSCLSGGERQLAYFAMNLCQDAEIILLDEPTSNLDAVHEMAILSAAKELCKEGKTIICVMHNLSMAIKYADDVVIINSGKCCFSGSIDKCLELKMIEKNFDVRKYDSNGMIFFSS